MKLWFYQTQVKPRETNINTKRKSKMILTKKKRLFSKKKKEEAREEDAKQVVVGERVREQRGQKKA